MESSDSTAAARAIAIAVKSGLPAVLTLAVNSMATFVESPRGGFWADRG
jgi:hypothetical protein